MSRASKPGSRRYVTSLYLFYAFYYMIMACSGYYPVYFGDIGLNNAQIGSIQAVAPLVAMALQTFWGMLGDRMKRKRTLLAALLLAYGVACVFMRFAAGFWVVMALYTLISVLQTPCTPLMDTITLEYTKEHNHAFGPIRMMGSVGYVAMAWGAGLIMQNDTGRVFIILAALAGVLAVLALTMPPVAGHQRKAERVSIRVLTQNRDMMLLFVIIFMASITTTFGHGFFSKHFSQLGASNAMVGSMLFVSAFLEIPFLLFADKILPRLSIWAWVLLGLALTGARWLFIGVTTNLYLLMAAQTLNLFATICFTYAPVLYVNRHAPPQLSVTAQSFMAFVSFGISRVIGSLLGGWLSDIYTIPVVFTINGVFMLVCLAVFTFVIAKTRGWSAIFHQKDF